VRILKELGDERWLNGNWKTWAPSPILRQN
jgi:hypothetical protein